ncbi:LOW QUALITY PROTEIN: Lipase [Phytophthora palmivora]|uniref:Lipase n=1 Tax=Phytophthora palmivora TaxID=4796 RepID=A0A2P4YBK8_9STRA|nr:LOW QUALITY PROTEIN: Lipase [Phytophthora palmivora]
MQSNSLDVELQRTLYELCADLFATSILDDCNAILQSLALLAEAFPQAQSLLGRLLSRKQDRFQSNTSSKLSVLSTELLYRNETACSSVSLLAALANGNVRNQRRIVENVTGVKLDIDLSKYDHRSSTRVAEKYLYALTSPSQARTEDGVNASENCSTVVYPVVCLLRVMVFQCRVTVTAV